MWILVLMFLLAVPAWAEDLGELSANPARFSGSFGLSGLSGFSGLSGGVCDPTNKTNETDQIDQIDQFRLSQRRRESLQPQQSHESLRPRPPN